MFFSVLKSSFSSTKEKCYSVYYLKELNNKITFSPPFWYLLSKLKEAWAHPGIWRSFDLPYLALHNLRTFAEPAWASTPTSDGTGPSGQLQSRAERQAQRRGHRGVPTFDLRRANMHAPPKSARGSHRTFWSVSSTSSIGRDQQMV